MYNFELHILGIGYLRMNKLNETLDKPTKPGKIRNLEQRMEDAKKKIYRDEKEQICIEARALKACGKNGASRVKISRRSFIQDFKATIFFEERFISLLDKSGKLFKEQSGFHTENVRRPPKKGPLIPETWPYFADWQLRTIGNCTDDRIAIETIEEAFVNGGLLFGLLDGRPDWGRFIVKSIKKF